MPFHIHLNVLICYNGRSTWLKWFKSVSYMYLIFIIMDSTADIIEAHKLHFK